MPAYAVVGSQFRAANDLYAVVGTQLRRVTDGYAVVDTQLRRFYQYSFWDSVQVGDEILGGMLAGFNNNYAIILWHTGSSSLSFRYWHDLEEYCHGLISDGYVSWRVGSLTEWTVIWNNREILDAAGYAPPLTNLTQEIWTGTEVDSLNAYTVNLQTGQVFSRPKNTTHAIRAIRRVAVS